MKKSSWLVALSVLLVISIFAGCSFNKPASSNASKLEVVKVWTNNGGTKDLVTKMVDDYNETTGKQKGIKIEYTVHGNDYKKIIDMAISSGQAPDMFNVQGSRISYVQKGNIMAIEDLPVSADFLKRYEGKLTPMDYFIDGKTYAVPFGVTTIGLLYNKELLKKAGYVDAQGAAKPPQTWKELSEYAKKLTNVEDRVYGIALPLKWGGYFDWDLIMPYSASYDGSIFDRPTAQYNYSIISPVFEWMLQIKKDQSYLPGAEGLDNDPARAQFAEGRVAMMFGASWDVGVLNDQFVAKQDWGVAPVPVLDASHKYKQTSTSQSFVEVSASAKSKDLTKIADVFEWFNSDEFLVKLYEEGKNIPYDSRIVDMAKKQTDKKGWKDFASMLDRSFSPLPNPSVAIEGESSSNVYMKIWAGKVTVEEGLNDLTKRYNAGLAQAIADGKVDLSKYAGPNADKTIK